MSIADNLNTIAENVPKVYDAGHTKGLMDFQNMLSRNGRRGVYTNVFQGADFSGFTFNPMIYPTHLSGLFYNYAGAEFPKGIDFSKVNNTESVTDTSKIPYQLFAYCRNQERIPDMNIPVQYYYTYTFRTCFVKKIDIIRVAETTQYYNAFSGCVYLEDVTFEGTIGSNISFANSPLTVECLKHIIEHLKDFSGDAENYHKYTLTVKNSAFSKLDTEGATAEYNGVACTWAELIDNKKWNLVKG